MSSCSKSQRDLESRSLKNEKSGKNPNIKEFIKYLDQTLEMFDQHISEEDFEKHDSDIYKLFTTLFHMYGDISKNEHIKKNTNSSSESTTIDANADISDIIVKHIEKKKQQRKEKLLWENQRQNPESEKIARHIYKRSLREIETSDNGPIIFTADKIRAAELEKKKNNKINMFFDYALKNISHHKHISTSETIPQTTVGTQSAIESETIMEQSVQSNESDDYSDIFENTETTPNPRTKTIIQNKPKVKEYIKPITEKKSLQLSKLSEDHFIGVPNELTMLRTPDLYQNKLPIMTTPKPISKPISTNPYENTDEIDKKINNLRRMLLDK